MDSIKKWTLLISAVAVISGILLSVLPEGKLKGAYKALTGVILLYAFLYPMLSGNTIDFNVDDFLSDNYEISENIDKYALSAVISSAEKAIKELIDEEIKKNNINCEIKVQCSEEKGEIIIDSLCFTGTLTKEEKTQVINIAKSLGFREDAIIFIGESDEQ